MSDQVSVFDLPDDEFRRVLVDKINGLIKRERELRNRIGELEDKVQQMDEVDPGQIRDEVLERLMRK
jgi:hypothetical protein